MLDGLKAIVDFLLSGVHSVLDLLGSLPSWIAALSDLFSLLPSWLVPLFLAILSAVLLRLFIHLLPG